MTLKPLKSVPLFICAGATLLACCAQLFLHRLHFLQKLEWMTYDERMKMANNFHPPVSDKLGFVAIGDDAVTLFAHGLLGTNWQFGLKWPRHIYGTAVRELKEQGAEAVGLDVFFDLRRFDHVIKKSNGSIFDPDKEFAQELRNSGNVILGGTEEAIPHPLFRAAAAGLGDLTEERDADGVMRRLFAFHDYRVWDQDILHQAILRAWTLTNAVIRSNQIQFSASTNTFVLELTPEGYFDPNDLRDEKPAGGIVRLRKAFEDVRVWHLGIALAARDLNLDLEKALVELDKHRIILTSTNGLQRIIPVDDRGQFLVDWSVSINDPRLMKEAFESLVAHNIERRNGTNILPRFESKLVIVGSMATGNELSDRGATPLEKDTFLTSNYWNVINSVLLDRFIHPTSLVANLVLVLLLGLGGAALASRLPTLWATLLVALLVTGFITAALVAFIRYRFVLPMVTPLSAALLTHFGLLTYQTFFEKNERRRVKELFTKLVSPNVVNELLRTEKLSLIGARGSVTVFFADIRGFTEMSDRNQALAEEYVRTHELTAAEAKVYFDQRAQELLHTVNTYLGVIADIIKRHDGTLDKYIGDCVMAFWGAPTPNPHHALACVSAAIDAQRAVHRLNEERMLQNKAREQENLALAAQGLPPLLPLDLLTLGTGINTGLVTAGLMGSHDHIFNYTVFGRDVNLASRLEGYSGRGRIIIGEATWAELLRDDPALAEKCTPIQLPATALKGFGAAMKVFEVPWKNRIPNYSAAPATLNPIPAAG